MEASTAGPPDNRGGPSTASAATIPFPLKRPEKSFKFRRLEERKEMLGVAHSRIFLLDRRVSALYDGA
ncbi:hypothetical protein VSR68_22200 [Paraburkholderia phymatum]|uniref:hypothetical protein n=1 Tax=Paraburkholderia phymatum TaxID=148447 RepID=UPI00317BE56C